MEKLETISVPEVARILRKGQSVVRRRIENGVYPFGDCDRSEPTAKSPSGRRNITIYKTEFEAYLESIKKGERREAI